LRLAPSSSVAWARLVEAAGIQLLNSDPGLTGAIWYPCAWQAEHVTLGNLAVAADFNLMGVKDCPVTGAKLPLVILSHGHTGWFGANHDTAEALADAGFVVAAINHPGDNGNDPSHGDDPSVFASRPSDMVRLLNFMLHDWKDKAVIDPARIGVFGFSMGGYTGLVLMGVVPDSGRFAEVCKDKTGACQQLHSGEALPNPPHDARIKTAAIVDPATVTITRDNLAAIRIPFQFWRSERGGPGVMDRVLLAPQIVFRANLSSCRASRPLCLPGTLLAGACDNHAAHLHRQSGGLR
jgi:predicted dienelactone hydrolase